MPTVGRTARMTCRRVYDVHHDANNMRFSSFSTSDVGSLLVLDESCEKSEFYLIATTRCAGAIPPDEARELSPPAT
eukprot:1877152-Pleurochrysis_carterae.AAC.3